MLHSYIHMQLQEFPCYYSDIPTTCHLMSTIMISLQLRLPTENTDALTTRLQFSLLMQPVFVYLWPPAWSYPLRTTFKPTSVHCEERRTIKTDKHRLYVLGHSSASGSGYAHLFGGASEPIGTSNFMVCSRNIETATHLSSPWASPPFVACSYMLSRGLCLLHSVRILTCVRYLVEGYAKFTRFEILWIINQYV